VMNPTAAAITPTVTFEGAPATLADPCLPQAFTPLMAKEQCAGSAAAAAVWTPTAPIPAGQAVSLLLTYPVNGMPAFVKTAATAGAVVWLEVGDLA
jgi:hypothetical protein